MLNRMVEQLGLLAEAGVRVEMVSRFAYRVYGFYKSDSVLVNLANNTVTARYEEVSEFDPEHLKEKLVELNYEWWERSAWRHDGWSQPDAAWKPLLVAAEYEVEE
jgi:hypothetical protein